MPQHIPWNISVKGHPGSSEQAIKEEPDWVQLQAHAIGFKNKEGRRAGLTHVRDHDEAIEAARKLRADLHQRMDTGDLVNFRDVIQNQTDFHLRYPENRSLGWRYVLETTEDWVKYQQKWPINLEKLKKEEEMAEKQGEEQENEGPPAAPDPGTEGKDQQKQEEESKEDEDKPELSPQDRLLLETLKRDAAHRASLKVNDGKQKCPQTHNRSSVTIDEQDQFTPDNWLPRCPDLIRLTGKHPLNAEPSLSRLLDGGLITPNELHFVRNHGSVPRLLWELHQLDITHDNHTISLSMDELKTRYTATTINIPIAMACVGNRRKELNLIRKTKGANNAAGSVGCAYWKGPTLRSVLLSAGVPDPLTAAPDTTTHSDGPRRQWVHFAGADSPSEGPYETSISLDYAMNPHNDVLLALEMNDLPLPPDHGYPVRVMVPGYIGGRCVKWLKRIWVSDKENDSYYHIWDNRVVPGFVREKEGPVAEALFTHPSTICNEQILNAVVCRPAHGERIPLRGVEKGAKYRVRGLAYNGAGHEVQQVEVSLDMGESWLFAAREFPEYPIRHGDKFWTWVFWEVEVDVADLVRAPGVVVRCSDAGKNMQPRDFKWNVLGMMNNSWYTVKTETVQDEEDDSPAVLFRHPTEAGASTGGWMQPSAELRIAQAKQDAATPQKQFTREDIEKHDKEGDCWLVIDNKVYDVTSVLAWHPGGKAAIMAHAAKCHYETTEEFSSIHDDFAYQKLQGMDGPLSLNIRTSPVTDKHCRMHSRRSNRENIQVHQADGGISSQGAGEERSATGRQQPPGVAETPLGARQASRPEGSLRRHAHLHV
jgi:nitrate reductase (NAD(P)H)